MVVITFLNTILPPKWLAKKFGHYSRYVLTKIGLMLTAFTIISPVKFPNPGFLVIPDSMFISKKENGLIGLIGILLNTLLGITYIFLGWFLPVAIIPILFVSGAFITSQITLFLLIPTRETFGRKIFDWSKILYFVLLAINLAIFIGTFFLGILF